MELTVLPRGPALCISQDLGAGARGCQLDPGALERAVARVDMSLAEDAPELLIVNKFGKREAEGHGFAPDRNRNDRGPAGSGWHQSSEQARFRRLLGWAG
jgi:hypothetical protein